MGLFGLRSLLQVDSKAHFQGYQISSSTEHLFPTETINVYPLAAVWLWWFHVGCWKGLTESERETEARFRRWGLSDGSFPQGGCLGPVKIGFLKLSTKH